MPTNLLRAPRVLDPTLLTPDPDTSNTKVKINVVCLLSKIVSDWRHYNQLLFDPNLKLNTHAITVRLD